MDVTSRGSEELDTKAISIRFRLFASRVSSTLLTPCFTVRLKEIEVVRLLDPELGESFVSLARLFVAARVPLLDGLRKFDLRKPDYDTNLGNLAPFDDIWVSLKTASIIARALGSEHQLGHLLDSKSKLAWSLDDGDEAGILHNWKVPQSSIDPTAYSTAALLENPIGTIAVFQAGVQMRTSLDRTQIKTEALLQMQRERHEQVLSHLVVWLTLIYEDWLEEMDNATIPSAGANGQETSDGERPWHDTDIHLDLLDKVLLGLAALTAGGSGPGASQQPATHDPRIELLRYGRRDLSDKTTRLVYVDALARTLAYVWTAASFPPDRRKPFNATPETIPDKPQAPSAHASGNIVAEHEKMPVVCLEDMKVEMAQLDARIASLEATVSRPDRTPSTPASSLSAPATQLERLAGLRGWTLVVFAATSYLLVSKVIDLAERGMEALHYHLGGLGW